MINLTQNNSSKPAANAKLQSMRIYLLLLLFVMPLHAWGASAPYSADYYREQSDSWLNQKVLVRVYKVTASIYKVPKGFYSFLIDTQRKGETQATIQVFVPVDKLDIFVEKYYHEDKQGQPSKANAQYLEAVFFQYGAQYALALG